MQGLNTKEANRYKGIRSICLEAQGIVPGRYKAHGAAVNSYCTHLRRVQTWWPPPAISVLALNIKITELKVMKVGKSNTPREQCAIQCYFPIYPQLQNTFEGH